jgi:hypothetical protein
VLAVNADRSTRDAIQILASLLASAIHPDPDYRLPMPTLLIHGDGDGMVDIVSGTRAWAEREPQADYVTIPSAGHASNQDNPRAFTAELTTFLDRVLSPAQQVAGRAAPATRVPPRRWRTHSPAASPASHPPSLPIRVDSIVAKDAARYTR